VIELTRRVLQHTQAAARTVEDQTLIVLAQRGEVLVLNASGTWLWEQLAGGPAVGELVAGLAARYGLAQARALTDVQAFLDSLLAVEAAVLAGAE
jgi:hypothetical protein